MKIRIVSHSRKQTLEIGKAFAKLLRGGEALALVGDLGSGKTTFVKGLAKGLGIKSHIVSPTFTVMQPYRYGKNKTLYHLDLYRIKSSKELEELGFAEIVNNRSNITVIEWARRAGKKLPAKTIMVKFLAPKRHPRDRVITFS